MLASWISTVRRTTMTYYAGLDVSLKEVSICVVDAAGAVQLRGTIMRRNRQPRREP